MNHHFTYIARLLYPYLIIGWEDGVLGPGGIWGQVQGVGSDNYGTSSLPSLRLHMGWPLKARRGLFPDWPWLCDESSPLL